MALQNDFGFVPDASEATSTPDAQTNNFGFIPDETTSQISTPQETESAPPAPASPAIKTSLPWTVAGEAARNIAPLGAAVVSGKAIGPVTRAAGAWAGGRAGALIGALVPGLGETGVSEGIGAVVGGIIGEFAPQFIAGAAAKEAQTKAADALAPNSLLSSKVEQAQESAHPIVSTIVPLLMLGKPSTMNLVRAGRTMATTDGRRALVSLLQSSADKDALADWTKTTAPEVQKDVGNVLRVAQAGGINAAFNLADQIQSGHLSVSQLLESAAEGTLFNSPWIHARNPATDKFEEQSGIPQESEAQNETQNAETPVEKEPAPSSLSPFGGVAPVGQTKGKTEIGAASGGGEDKGIKSDENIGDSSLQTIGQIAAMSPKEFLDYVAPERSGELSALTRKAYELGQAADSQESVDALKNAATQFKDFRSQFFREAYEAATGTGSAGLSLSKDPDYHPPFPTSALPKATEVSTSQPAGEVTPTPPVASLAKPTLPKGKPLTSSKPSMMNRPAATGRTPEDAVPKQPVKKEWKPIGVNSEGNQVFEDQNGVRSYVNNNVRVTEPQGVKQHGQEFIPATDAAKRTPEQVLGSTYKVIVKAPKGATMFRVVGDGGKVSTVNLSEMKSGWNPFYGVNVESIEAGIIGKNKKFKKVEGEVTVEPKIATQNKVEPLKPVETPISANEQTVIEPKQARLPKPRGEITWQEAGYPSEQVFHRDYQTNGLHELREDADEFLRRRFCSGTVPRFAIRSID